MDTCEGDYRHHAVLDDTFSGNVQHALPPGRSGRVRDCTRRGLRCSGVLWAACGAHHGKHRSLLLLISTIIIMVGKKVPHQRYYSSRLYLAFTARTHDPMHERHEYVQYLLCKQRRRRLLLQVNMHVSNGRRLEKCSRTDRRPRNSTYQVPYTHARTRTYRCRNKETCFISPLGLCVERDVDAGRCANLWMTARTPRSSSI